MTRLCWCQKDASHRTVGGIVDYLCDTHARQAESVVQVEQIFQDCGDSRCAECGQWAECGTSELCDDCAAERVM